MVGNRVFAHSLIFLIAAALLFAPWGSVRVDATRRPARPALEPNWIQAANAAAATSQINEDGAEAPAGARQELVFGWQGAIALGQVRVAYWMICLCLMAGALASALNYLKCTTLPAVLIFASFGFTAACSLVAVIHHALLGSVGTGSLLAIAAALVGLLMSPPDGLAETADVVRIEESPRQFRSAA